MFLSKSTVLKQKMMNIVEEIDLNKLDWVCKKIHDLDVNDRLDFAEYAAIEICKNPFMDSREEWLSKLASAGDPNIQAALLYTLIIHGYEYAMKTKIAMNDVVEVYGEFRKDGYMFQLNTLVDGRSNDEAIPVFIIALFISGAFDHNLSPPVSWSILKNKTGVFDRCKTLVRSSINPTIFNKTIDVAISAPFGKKQHTGFFEYLEFTKPLADENGWTEAWIAGADRYMENFVSKEKLVVMYKEPVAVFH